MWHKTILLILISIYIHRDYRYCPVLHPFQNSERIIHGKAGGILFAGQNPRDMCLRLPVEGIVQPDLIADISAFETYRQVDFRRE